MEHYKVVGEQDAPAHNDIQSCQEACSSAFGDGIGTVACPTSDLEMVLLQNLFKDYKDTTTYTTDWWTAYRRAWIGLYRVDSCSAAEVATADADKLAQCTSWNQCSTGAATPYQKFEETPTNAGSSCPINLKCATAKWTHPYVASVTEYPCDATVNETAYREAYLGRGWSPSTRNRGQNGKRRNKNNIEFEETKIYPAVPEPNSPIPMVPKCFCEHSAPANGFIEALEELKASSPGAVELCNPFVKLKTNYFCRHVGKGQRLVSILFIISAVIAGLFFLYNLVCGFTMCDLAKNRWGENSHRHCETCRIMGLKWWISLALLISISCFAAVKNKHRFDEDRRLQGIL